MTVLFPGSGLGSVLCSCSRDVYTKCRCVYSSYAQVPNSSKSHHKWPSSLCRTLLALGAGGGAHVETGFSMWSWLSCNLLYRLDWPKTHVGSTILCHPLSERWD